MEGLQKTNLQPGIGIELIQKVYHCGCSQIRST